jgi:hypothetical protein
MKNCKHCGVEFSPKNDQRGHEQIYCSINCRMKAYKIRKMNEYKEQPKDQDKSEGREIDIQRTGNDINGSRMPYADVNLEILEGKYQAKTEALEYKLKFEQATKELEIANKRIFELEQEIDELDDENDVPENSFLGIISGIAEKSPVFADAVGKIISNENVQHAIVSMFPKKP